MKYGVEIIRPIARQKDLLQRAQYRVLPGVKCRVCPEGRAHHAGRIFGKIRGLRGLLYKQQDAFKNRTVLPFLRVQQRRVSKQIWQDLERIQSTTEKQRFYEIHNAAISLAINPSQSARAATTVCGRGNNKVASHCRSSFGRQRLQMSP